MTLLSKLQDPAPNGPLATLARLIVVDAMARPLGEVVDAELWPRMLKDTLDAWAASDVAEERMVAAVHDGIEALDGLDGTLSDRMPDAVSEGLRELAAHPYSPSRELVLRLLDQPPVRKLLREILLDAVTGFAKKARAAGETSPVGGLASGLGRFAKRRAGTLGALAGDVVGAVGSEVERQVEKRAGEFVDAGMTGAIADIADQIADPERAEDQAALRTALLNAALALTGPELAAELRGSDPAALGRLVRNAAQGWVGGDGFEGQVRGWLQDLTEAEGERTLGESLDGVSLRDTISDAATELLLAHAARLISTDAFADWLQRLEDS